jgi:hypothetical protein
LLHKYVKRSDTEEGVVGSNPLQVIKQSLGNVKLSRLFLLL